MEMSNDRVLTLREMTAAQEMEEIFVKLNEEQQQRVIGFAACLRTVETVAMRRQLPAKAGTV